jgi:hypothetical protein
VSERDARLTTADDLAARRAPAPRRELREASAGVRRVGRTFPAIGSYYWQQADQAWEYVYAVFQAVFWPAYMVFAAFGALHA